MLIKVISGGQTGVDQAALKAALLVGLETGGYAPKGFKTERGPTPSLGVIFGLVEAATPNYATRTYLNVENSDGTLLLLDPGGEKSRGTACAINAIKHYNKPMFTYRRDYGSELFKRTEQSALLKWIEDNNIRVLNVAGHRESAHIGIGKWAEELLSTIFKKLKEDS